LALRAAIFTEIAQNESKSLQDISGECPAMQDDIHRSRRLGAALLAGLIAIVVNTAVLEAADWIPLVTAEAAS
jgi:predicted phage tail protein